MTSDSASLWQGANMEQGLFQWIEETIGKAVTALTKQKRGRDAWFVECGEDRFYVRGDRAIDGGIAEYYSLDREWVLLEQLEKTNVLVPPSLGYNREHKALLQKHVYGDVFFHHIDDDDYRETVGNNFMKALSDLHALKPEDLNLPEETFHVPTTAHDHVWHDLQIWVDVHYNAIEDPEPFMTYAVEWLKRFEPDHVCGTVIVQGDTGPGQFIYKDGQVQAIVDWESAHWGCPMEELGQIRQRDLLYPFGDMMTRFKAYEEYSGTPLDMDLIYYYTVRSLINTPLCLIGPELLYPKEHADIAERLAWNALFLRVTAEALAEAMAIDISNEVVELPPEPPSTEMSRLYDCVYSDLKNEQQPLIEDDYQAHRMGSTTYLFEHLRTAYKFGPAMEEQELDEMTELLGSRPQSVKDGQRLLEKKILAGDPAMDEAFIRYFYRYSRRKELILGDAVFSQGDQAKVASLQLLRKF